MKANYKAEDNRGQLKLSIATQLLPNTPPLPYGNYSLIACDPPWSYQLRETDPSHRGRTPYPNMSDEDILNLGVGAIAATDAYLLLWTTNNHLPLAFQCVERWGFEYKAIHTWLKITSKATPHLGIGHYGRNCTEHFLICTKGNPGTFTALGITDSPNVMLAPRGEHSAKPEQFYRLCDRLFSALGGERIDLFARTKREGWDAWGAEITP